MQIQDWFEDAELIYIAMEHFQYGDLQNYMNQNWSEVQVKNVASQLLEAIAIMHNNGFTHRDIKPANIFVVERHPWFRIKRGDSCISKRVVSEQTDLRTEIGTRHYVAPEVLGFVDEDTCRYTDKVDLWALGSVLHRLLTTEPPFAKVYRLASYCWGKINLPIFHAEIIRGIWPVSVLVVRTKTIWTMRVMLILFIQIKILGVI